MAELERLDQLVEGKAVGPARHGGIKVGRLTQTGAAQAGRRRGQGAARTARRRQGGQTLKACRAQHPTAIPRAAQLAIAERRERGGKCL